MKLEISFVAAEVSGHPVSSCGSPRVSSWWDNVPGLCPDWIQVFNVVHGAPGISEVNGVHFVPVVDVVVEPTE